MSSNSCCFGHPAHTTFSCVCDMTSDVSRHVADTTQNAAVWQQNRHADIRHNRLSLYAIIDSLLNRVAIVICTYVYQKCKRDCLYSLIILCLFVMIAIARRHQRVCCGRTSIFTMRMRFRTSSAEC